jgi:hypothetical protein
VERWWNCVIEIRVPFDTREEARTAYNDNEVIEALFAIFGTKLTGTEAHLRGNK